MGRRLGTILVNSLGMRPANVQVHLSLSQLGTWMFSREEGGRRMEPMRFFAHTTSFITRTRSVPGAHRKDDDDGVRESDDPGSSLVG